MAGAMGAAIALVATGRLPSTMEKMLGVDGDKAAVASKPAGDPKKTPDQPAVPAVASADPRPIGEDMAPAASVRGATERAPTIRGVTDTEIRLGISAPFTGSAKELGNEMKLGIETAFNVINESGGIH